MNGPKFENVMKSATKKKYFEIWTHPDFKWSKWLVCQWSRFSDFCTDIKWFLTKRRLFLWISNGWTYSFQIKNGTANLCSFGAQTNGWSCILKLSFLFACTNTGLRVHFSSDGRWSISSFPSPLFFVTGRTLSSECFTFLPGKK